jgi:hypothetical protein
MVIDTAKYETKSALVARTIIDGLHALNAANHKLCAIGDGGVHERRCVFLGRHLSRPLSMEGKHGTAAAPQTLPLKTIHVFWSAKVEPLPPSLHQTDKKITRGSFFFGGELFSPV